MLYVLILLIIKCNSANTTIEIQITIWLIFTGMKASRDARPMPNKYTVLYMATGA